MHPIAPSVYKELEKTNYLKNFISINNYLKSDSNFFNFTQKKYFNNCQFIDGTHSGEVLNLMILKDISNYKKYLLNFISTNITENDLVNNLNRVTFKNHNKYFYNETDFLDIGCKK